MTEHLGLLSDTNRRVVVAGNADSTNANDFNYRVEEARKDFSADPALRGRLMVLPHRDSFSHTINDIQHAVRAGDFLVAGGGDGTGNAAAGAIMGHPIIEVRNGVSILLMPAGQASLGSNDLLENQGQNMSILRILAGGEELDFSPTEMTVYNPVDDGPKTKLAFFLSGIAGPAKAEWYIEKGRKHNWLRKVEPTRRALGLTAIMRGIHAQNKDPLQMIVNRKEFEGAGALSANVNVYAQVLPTPVNAREPGLASLVLSDPSLWGEAKLAAKAKYRKEGWIKTEPGKEFEVGIRARPKQKIMVSRDAEVEELKSDPDEEVYIRIVQRVHDQTVKMVALSRV